MKTCCLVVGLLPISGSARSYDGRKEPEFDAAYRKARRAAHAQSIARLQQATSAAVSTLLKVMVDAGTPASTKVRAADNVLNHSAKAIEIEDIEARVSELERTTGASNQRRAAGENDYDRQKSHSAGEKLGNSFHADKRPTGFKNPVRHAREGGDEYNVARTRSPCGAVQGKAE
jgi:hypothetical protein